MIKVYEYPKARHLQDESFPSTLHRNTSDAPQGDALAYLPDAIVMANDQARISYLNPAAEQLLGLSLEYARGQALDKVLVLKDRETQQILSASELSSRNAPFAGKFHYLVTQGGALIPVQYSVARTRTPFGTDAGYIVSLRDASALQQHIDKLVTQTMHDEHTRLLRRAELVKRMWRLLQEHESDSDDPHAFLYMDLNNFKAVNDTAGHAAGDMAIRQIASRLKGVVRERDTLARLGGDEFGLLLEHCPPDLARERAQQLHRTVESYVLNWNGEQYRLGISIGLALFKTHQHSLNTILAAADAACYEAKRNASHDVYIREVTLD